MAFESVSSHFRRLLLDFQRRTQLVSCEGSPHCACKHMEALSKIAQLQIFSFLPLKAIGKCERVSKSFRQTIILYWRALCERHENFKNLSHLRRSTWKAYYCILLKTEIPERSIKRMKTELKNVELLPSTITAVRVDESLFQWHATIEGRNGSPYEGGLYHLDVLLPLQYPFSPPQIKFVTPILHINIKRDGDVTGSLSILQDDWRPQHSFLQILQYLSTLMSLPNFHEPVVMQLADLWKRDQQAYFELVKEYCCYNAKK